MYPSASIELQLQFIQYLIYVQTKNETAERHKGEEIELRYAFNGIIVNMEMNSLTVCMLMLMKGQNS